MVAIGQPQGIAKPALRADTWGLPLPEPTATIPLLSGLFWRVLTVIFRIKILCYNPIIIVKNSKMHTNVKKSF